MRKIEKVNREKNNNNNPKNQRESSQGAHGESGRVSHGETVSQSLSVPYYSTDPAALTAAAGSGAGIFCFGRNRNALMPCISGITYVCLRPPTFGDPQLYSSSPSFLNVLRLSLPPSASFLLRPSPLLDIPHNSHSMTTDSRDPSGQAPANGTVSRARDYFSVPAPIKRFFDHFPLVTYPPNDLPQRALSSRRGNRLFVFTDAAGARHGSPSFNPQCLKWQVWRCEPAQVTRMAC